MELKGSVIVTASTTGTSGIASDIAFQVSNAAGGESIDLTAGKTLIKYTDPVQSKMFTSTSGITVTALGDADSAKLLERNETYELKLIDLENSVHATNDDTLKSTLGVNTTFQLEVIPPKGAVLFIERTTPIFFDDINSLD